MKINISICFRRAAALLDELTELLVAAAAAVGESHFPPLPSRQFVGGMVVGG